MMAHTLNQTLWVLILACLKWSRLSRLSSCCLAVGGAVRLVLGLREVSGLSLSLLHVDRVVLLPIVLCCEVGSLRPLMVMVDFPRVLAGRWFWTVVEISRITHLASIDHYVKHGIAALVRARVVSLMRGVMQLLLLLHLLLVVLLLLEHLLLLVLTQAIELIMLHRLLLLLWHRRMFIRIGKEIVLFHVWLVHFRSWAVEHLALLRLHDRRLLLLIALMRTVDHVVLEAVKVFLGNWLRIFGEWFAFWWSLD